MDESVDAAPPPLVERTHETKGESSFLSMSRDVWEERNDRNLPVEMLTEVFRRCVDFNTAPNSKQSPLSLSHVCLRWRQAIADSPFLWQSFYVPFSYRTRTDGITHLLRTWLDRSRGLCVRIDVALGDYSYLPLTLVPLIVDNLHRFSCIRLSMPERLLRPLLEVKHATTDALAALSIEASQVFVDAQSMPACMLGFDSALSLREVTLRLLSSFTRCSLARFAWHQIEVLNVESICPSIGGPHILSGCSELVECKLNMGGWSQETGLYVASEQEIFLGRLRTLDVTFTTRGVCGTFLKVLTLPHLRVLAVTILDDVDDWPRVVFLDLQLRSNFSLVEFRVRCMLLATADMLTILRQNYAIRRICVVDSGCATSELYDNLTVIHGRSLVPSLEHVEIWGATGPLPYTVVADMLISRIRRDTEDGDTRSTRLLSAVVAVKPSWHGPLLERRMSIFESEGFILDVV